jgi:hypothetical protein
LRIVHGLTSKTLIEDVRSSHQWCLLDVVSLLVRRDLAGGWSLEAIMRLPALAKEPVHCSAAIESKGNEGEEELEEEGGVEYDEDAATSQSAAYPFVTKVLQATVHLHTQTHSGSAPDTAVSAFSTHARVDCTSCARASALPLYLSFMRMIELAVPHGVSIARAQKTGRSDQLRMDEITLRADIASSDEHAYLNEALQMIESVEALWYSWVSDFVTLNLRYADHTEQEVHLLVRIAEILVNAGCTNANVAHRNVLRWVLLQDDLRRYLFPASRAIQATCRAFPELVGEMDCLQFTSVEDFVAQLLRKTQHRAWEYLWESPGKSEPSAYAGTSMAAVLDCLRYCFATPELSPPSAAFASVVVHRTATEQNRFTAMVGVLKLSSIFEAPALFSAFQIGDSQSSVSQAPLLREAKYLGFFPETAADSMDPLRAMLVIMASACTLPQEGSLGGRSGHTHALLDCLFWVLSHSEIGYSLWLEHMVGSLLTVQAEGNVSEGDRRARWVIDGLLSNCALSINARSQLLALALSKSTQGTERAIDRSLRLTTSAGSTAFVPEVIAAVVRERAPLDGLRPIGRNSKISASITDSSACVLFKGYHQYFMNANDRPREFSDCFVCAKKLALASTTSAAVAHSVMAKLILDKIAAMISSAVAAASGSKETKSILGDLPVEQVLAATELLGQDRSQVWTHYLLAMIADPATLVDVLCDDALLTCLGIGDWTCARFPPVQEGATLTEEEARQRQEDAQRLNNRVTHLVHVSHAIRTNLALHALTADCTPRHIMSSIPTQSQEGNEARDKPALDVLQLFGSQDYMEGLPANKHIPALVSMSLFLLEKLAFRLRNSGQIADLTVEQALKMLPLAEKLTGEAKFAEFLAAWKELRSVFRTFNQCGGELATANEIPELTDCRGANPARVMDLVAVEDFPDHVPVVRRMLELRLLLQTSNIVTHPAVQALQDSVWNGTSALEWIGPEVEVEALTDSMASTMLVGNPLQDAGVRSEINFLVMSLSEGHVPEEVAAPTGGMEEATPARAEVSLEQYIAATQLQMARENQMQAHVDGLGCCPNCKRVVYRHDGCQHVCCGRANDPYGRNAAIPLYAVYNNVQSGDLGCGTSFDITANRVPAPPPNGDVLEFFKPTRVSIPAHLLGMANLQLPLLPPISVTYRLDSVPIALQLLKLGVSGRPKLILGDRIKRPLQLIPSASAENVESVKEVVLDPAASSTDTNVFARLQYTSNLLWGKDAFVQSTELREFKSILLNQPEATLETIAGVLLRGCLCISAALDRVGGNMAGSKRVDGVLKDMTFSEIVATHLVDDPPKVRMPLRTSQVIDALPYGQLQGAVHLVCEAGLNSWGISGNRSAAPLPSACAKHWKELQAEILAAAAQESAAAAVATPNERGQGQEKIQVVQVQLQALSTLLQGKRDHFAVMPDDVLIRNADGAIQAFLMQPSNALLHKLVAELELRHIPALERAIRVILGNIAYCALSGSNRSGRSSTITPEEGGRAQTAAPSARPMYTERADLITTPSAQRDVEEAATPDDPADSGDNLPGGHPEQREEEAGDPAGAGTSAGAGYGCNLTYPLRYDRDALIEHSATTGLAGMRGDSVKEDAVGAAEVAIGRQLQGPLPPVVEWSKEGLAQLWYAGVSMMYSSWVQKDTRE